MTNLPFHPPGTLAGKLPGGWQPGWEGRTESQPLFLRPSLRVGGRGAGWRPGREALGWASRGSAAPKCGTGARGRPPAPNREGWRSPRAVPPRIFRCAPRSAGTHRPAASCFPSAAVGEVCVRVSTGNGAVARQPARPRPAAPPVARRETGRGRRAAPRSPSLLGVQTAAGTLAPAPDPGGLSLDLRTGSGAPGRPRAGIQGGRKPRPRGDPGKPLPSGGYRGSKASWPSLEAGRGARVPQL